MTDAELTIIIRKVIADLPATERHDLSAHIASAVLAALPPAGDDAVLDSYAEENQRLSDQLEAAIATLSQERAAIGWRDISTAPKDGTKVDLWITPVGISTGAGREPDCWWIFGRWWKYDEAFGDDQCRSQIWNATHWMPLPSAPQRTGEK